ncbi:hypothetical protein [Lentibacillus salicampi]|uniref:Uncharacterized protein n=1 Tax=Lentibacillus salicampi TaxID=175306 RepID=A0A4Y9A7S6_9BACI|nr:hypothetical protein [Lentibacillus salicampi]TFJ91829.1 hypothetical protein E4U82_15760 [Lentibacillus salicampi]
MESKQIVNKLEDLGYTVEFGKYEYWDSIPHVLHSDGSKTVLAKTFNKAGSTGVQTDVSFEKAKQAVEMKLVDINDLENTLLNQKINREAEELAKKYS